MVDRDDVWLDAAARVQASLDADLRAEAFEMYQAESARCRLIDRDGHIRVRLRCGLEIAGDLIGVRDYPRPEGVLAVDAGGHVLLIPPAAVAGLRGGAATLREEVSTARSWGSLLRECWTAQQRVRVLGSDGRWLGGSLTFVGADYVDLQLPNEAISIPLVSVEAWDLGAEAAR